MTDESPSEGPDEYPSEEELPDDPPSVDDLDPFIVDDDDIDSIDEFAVAEWKAQE